MATTDGIFLARPPDIGDGIRLAVKDLFDTAGLVTTYGSAIFADHVPAETAEAVRRLEAAGYANIGKTNLHEFAYGITSENPHFGTVPNPIAPDRIAGGSSGGSAAAVAAGLADAALGTDSGGSIRIPAACCGVVGFKPTYGLVSSDGCFPLAPTFDHVGPIARTVDECEQMLQVLSPTYEPTEIGSLADIRAGVESLDAADPLVAARFRDASANFPHRTDVRIAEPTLAIRDAISDLFATEVADVHRDLFAEHRELYGEDVAAKVESCLDVPRDAIAAGRSARETYRGESLEAVADVDVVLLPTLPCVAQPRGIGDNALRQRFIHYTFPFNALGWPALAVPCGAAEDGLPASIQIVGKPHADALVLAVGRRLASLVRGTPSE